jgi:membrane protein YdbS with pleckstrin-like domain
MSTKTEVRSGGMSAMGLLGVVFVTLKLLGITAVAGWSWWWVTAPFWGVLAIVLIILLIAAVGVGVAAVFSK